MKCTRMTFGGLPHLLITVFLMCVIVLALSMIYMFWDQLTDFVLSIIKEVGYHGKGA